MSRLLVVMAVMSVASCKCNNVAVPPQGTGGSSGTGGGFAGVSGGGAQAGGGGGVAGGTGGGTAASCVGNPAGAYVCADCPGASDSNTGTGQCPLRSISRGIVNATAVQAKEVFVAARYQNGQNTVYTENVVVPSGLTLRGRYNVSRTATGFDWSNRAMGAQDRTVIQNASPEGLRFALGSQRDTGIDGIAVRVAIAGSDRVGITVVDAHPTIRDFEVTGSSMAPFALSEVGVVVRGMTIRPTPKIELGTIGGIRATQTAIGVAITGATAEVSALTISQLFATLGRSVGVSLANAASSILTNVTAQPTVGTSCAAIAATGNLANIIIDNANATGCQPQGGMGLPQYNAGIVFNECPTGGARATLRNSRVVSGPVQNSTAAGLSVGVQASDGCGVDVMNNPLIQGANGQSVGSSNNAFGVLCTYQGLTKPLGTGVDAPCRIVGNASIIGSTGTGINNAAGIACMGSCASQSLSCVGSCSEIRDNKSNATTGNGGITGGAATGTLTGIHLEHSSPPVLRNSVTFNVNPNCGLGRGVLLQGSGSNLSNNGIIGQTCNGGTSVGVEYVAAARNGGGIPSATLNSNSILSHSWFGTVAGVPNVQAAVRTSQASGTFVAGAVKTGTFINNIFQVGPAGNGSGSIAAFQETSTSIDPSVLQSNDFFVTGSVSAKNLYLNENAIVVTSIDTINQFIDVSLSTGNVTTEPGFRDLMRSFPSIGATSMLRGAGAGVPPAVDSDFDQERRPMGSGGSADIGADEIQ